MLFKATAKQIFFLMLCIALLYFYHYELSSSVGIDFNQDYSSALSLREGGKIYGADVTLKADELKNKYIITNQRHYIENFHPPFSTIYYYFLTKADFITAAYLHSWIQIFSLIIALRMFSTFVLKADFNLYISLLCFALILPANYEAITLGQNSLLISSLLIIGLVHLFNKKNLASGIFLAAATAFKLYPLLLVFPLLYTKNFKALSSYLASLAALFFISLYLTGIESWQYYLEVVSKRNIIEWGADIQGISVAGIPMALFYFGDFREPYWYFSPELGITAFFLTSIITLLYYFYCLKKLPDNIIAIFLITLVFICLLSPVSWPHSLFLTVPFLLYLGWHFNSPQNKKHLQLIFLLYLFILLPNLPIARWLYKISQVNGYLPWWSFYFLKIRVLCLLAVPFVSIFIMRNSRLQKERVS
jgi:hypothetical protein